EDPRERIANLVKSKDRAGAFLWKTTAALLSYAAHRIPEISDDIVNIDNSMKWGFGWSHGPFEIWDAIGVRKSVQRMRQENIAFPQWIDRLLEQQEPGFYKMEKGTQYYWDVLSNSYKPVVRPQGMLNLNHWKLEHGVIKKNAGASLIDLGDGVACLEF